MTMNRVLAIVLAVLVVFTAYLWWPSDEAAVKRRLSDLGVALSVPANEQDLNRMTRLASIRGFLAEDIHVRTSDQDITPRDMVLALASRWSQPSGGAIVTFAVERLTFGGNDAARMHLTMTVTPRDGRADDGDVRAADIEMAKRNGDWVITRAETTGT